MFEAHIIDIYCGIKGRSGESETFPTKAEALRWGNAMLADWGGNECGMKLVIREVKA